MRSRAEFRFSGRSAGLYLGGCFRGAQVVRAVRDSRPGHSRIVFLLYLTMPAGLNCTPSVRHETVHRSHRSQASAAARGWKIRGRSIVTGEISGQPHGPCDRGDRRPTRKRQILDNPMNRGRNQQARGEGVLAAWPRFQGRPHVPGRSHQGRGRSKICSLSKMRGQPHGP
jgi:hypothetical protein